MKPEYTADEERLLNLEFIARVHDMPEEGLHVIKMFSRGMVNTPEAAYGVACLIDYFCPPVGDEEEISDYLWLLWSIMMDIVTSPDVTVEIQESFVKIILALKQHAKGDTNIWGVSSRSLVRLLYLEKSASSVVMLGRLPCLA
jgi:hypothetical protein